MFWWIEHLMSKDVGPGTSDVDDFNNRLYPYNPKLKAVPRILEGQVIFIPTVIDHDNKPEAVLCRTCVEAYAHTCFIINGFYLLKWTDAIEEAKRIQWKTK